jgi:hypothetical protein
MNSDPWLLFIFNCCGVPLSCLFIGFLFGSRAIRFRSPFYRADKLAGYANRQKTQHEQLQEIIKNPGK